MIMLSLLPPPPVFFCRCSCGKLALVLASSGGLRGFAAALPAAGLPR